MAPIPDEMVQVHAILEEYVAIHDEIFKFSWRKAIPIPGLFKAIDYGRHFRDLSLLASELERLSSNLKAKADTPELFRQYTGALLRTIQALRGMSGRLYEKGQGDLTGYPWSQYNPDVDEYKRLVNEYVLLLNPYYVVKKLFEDGKIQRELYLAFERRADEIGAVIPK